MSAPTRPGPARQIVLFDFDGTLTRRDSLFPFLRHALGTVEFLRRLPDCLPALTGLALKRLSNQDAKEAVLTRMLAGETLAHLQAKGREFAEGRLDRLLRPAGMRALQAHQATGHDCVLVSASLDLWLQPWAERHGLAGVVSSRLAVDDSERVTGRLDGTNCRGAAKPAAIAAWLATLPPEEPVDLVAAYGDSDADQPMLELARSGYRLRRGRFRRVHGPALEGAPE
ncbi:HAD family hydrolase [Thioalkalivibrio versutus]|uniref:HAD family hydrolase n=1 Tax=Thioalkalivibrio versutus TaxID=106634 RepID=A0A0G3G7R6_9GAMM|nr:HAD-IB family hydrolase [Thioalkalivibrio versutus]AKJ95537.1 HAD family hydrolase [Thioalkalivibrio versutus]